jgi:hypothetical protein
MEEEARQERVNAEIARAFNNKEWVEFAPCVDMPGNVLKKKLPLDPALTKCACCNRKDTWCEGMCTTCNNSPAYLKCLCAPTFCQDCMLTYANTNSIACDDPTCARHHFKCPTCRKFLTF